MPEKITPPNDVSLEKLGEHRDTRSSLLAAELTAYLDTWDASDTELPPPPNGFGGATSCVVFADAVKKARQMAEETPVGPVPEEWLATYFAAEPETKRVGAEASDFADFAEWLVARTACRLETLTEGLSERLLRLKRPLAAFTTQETDETILPETVLANDESVSAAIFKRSGRLLLRLQSRNVTLQNEIVAILLSSSPDSSKELGLFFVAMAATGVGDWSVGWVHISESERDTLLAKEPVVLRKVRMTNNHARLLPLLSLAAAAEAHTEADPLARSVWMEWMERWRQEMQDASAS